MTDLFLIAAEPSGDLLGAELAQALLQETPSLHIAAVAGPRLRALPIQTLFPMEDLQVIGFIDVLFALPSLWKTFRKIEKKILEIQPKAVLCIDYPGFNLRLEASLRKKGFKGKLIHYVSPTVWAWGKKRIPHMGKHLDLLLTLFPFEKRCFSSTSLPVEYAGHPLAKKQVLIKKETPLLALFPGSREKEIRRTFPTQLLAAKKLLEKEKELAIGISLASPSLKPLLDQLLQKIDLPITYYLPEEKPQLLEQTKVAIATSGTITLELALHQIPTLVTYGVSFLDRFIVQKILSIHLPFYCIVNILLSRQVFPEFYGPNLTLDHLFPSLHNIWTNDEARHAIIEGCSHVQKELGEQDHAQLAALHVLKCLK